MTNSPDDYRQPETSPESNRAPGPPQPVGSRLSSLAVVAVVVASLPCPPMSLLGAVLGLMALSRIRNSAGALRGATLARVAVVVSLVVTLTGVLVLRSLEGYFQRSTNQAITTTVHEFVVQAGNGNTSAALAQWDLGSVQVDVSVVESFGIAVTERLGSLKSLRVGKVSRATNASFLEQAVDAWLILEFESGSRNGSGRLALELDMTSFTWEAKLRQLRVEDPGGVLAIPPAAQEKPPAEADPGEPAST